MKEHEHLHNTTAGGDNFMNNPTASPINHVSLSNGM